VKQELPGPTKSWGHRKPSARRGHRRSNAAWSLVVGLTVLASCSGSSGTFGPSDDSAAGARTTATVEEATTTAASLGCDEGLATESSEGIEACGDLRLNDIQVIGTHNSFHMALTPPEQAEFAKLNPAAVEERNYTHASITDQLTKYGVRDLEFDIFWDSKGAYGSPWVAKAAGAEGPDAAVMGEPGIKVLHEQDVDYRSVCPTLKACLGEVAEFSDAHPDHVPITIHLQFKDGPIIFPAPGAVIPEKWTPAGMDELDKVLLAELGSQRVITPDEVRGDAATLRDAVAGDGWPMVKDNLGRVLITMIDNGAQIYRAQYLEDHDGLQGRVLFTQGSAASMAAETAPGGSVQGDVVFIGNDDPFADAPVSEWLKRGLLVRTRSDDRKDVIADPEVDRSVRRDAALELGAQFVVTDVVGEPAADGFIVGLPDDAIAHRRTS
jgi:hypothetical protein